jgi:hypothetical protein
MSPLAQLRLKPTGVREEGIQDRTRASSRQVKSDTVCRQEMRWRSPKSHWPLSENGGTISVSEKHV